MGNAHALGFARGPRGKDEIGEIITRKVFLPQNFLTQPNLVKQGITAQSEHEIRLVFELTGPAPTDFQLTMFYP